MADDGKIPEGTYTNKSTIPEGYFDTEQAEARHQEACPYYKALLSIIAVTQELGVCDDEALQACLQAEGIGEFYSYSKTLLEATEGESFSEEDETGADPANPEQENDEDASEEFEGDTL